MAVDTGKVTDRRKLRFEGIADVRRDLDALEAGHKAGTLRTTGNWMPGEILTHLAAWVNFGYEGYPKDVQPPWFIRWLIRMKKTAYLRDGFPSGVKIPGTKRGTIGMEDVPFEEGLRRLRAAYGRLEKSEPPIESPAWGRLAYADKIRLQMRHAELHLSFVHPR